MRISAPTTDLAALRALMTHPTFSLRNQTALTVWCRLSAPPTRCNFTRRRQRLPDRAVIALDALNPQVASRLARAMDRWRRYARLSGAHEKKSAAASRGPQKLSNDVREVI
jgi:aminopeptidase N